MHTVEVLLPSTRELTGEEEWDGIEVKSKRSKAKEAKKIAPVTVEVSKPVKRLQCNHKPSSTSGQVKTEAVVKKTEQVPVCVTCYYTDCFSLPCICSLSEVTLLPIALIRRSSV